MVYVFIFSSFCQILLKYPLNPLLKNVCMRIHFFYTDYSKKIFEQSKYSKLFGRFGVTLSSLPWPVPAYLQWRFITTRRWRCWGTRGTRWRSTTPTSTRWSSSTDTAVLTIGSLTSFSAGVSCWSRGKFGEISRRSLVQLLNYCVLIGREVHSDEIFW